MRRTVPICVLLALAPPAWAQGVTVHGLLDLRLVSTGTEPNWMEGGFGKLRWGGSDSPLQLGGAALAIDAPFAPAWLAHATVQAQADEGETLELQDAWLRWRPVSTGRWRHALKLGLMFPPVSLENEGIGWTSPYTLTPSALNTWIGEELRSTGLEWRAERRSEASGSLEFALTAFGGNDTTGELLATRGWALSDRVYGVGGSIRTPDPSAFDAPPPRRFDPFVEIDHRLGVSGEVTWRGVAQRVTALHYDNLADPSVETHFGVHEVYAWRTRFTSLAWEWRGARATWLAQALRGDTEIRPSPFFRTRTDYWAAYAMWARTTGAWRPAARVEWFGARQWPDELQPAGTEHGRALTLALTWQPREQWQFTAEGIAIHSVRDDRVLVGVDPEQSDAQVQLGWRWFF